MMIKLGYMIIFTGSTTPPAVDKIISLYNKRWGAICLR